LSACPEITLVGFGIQYKKKGQILKAASDPVLSAGLPALAMLAKKTREQNTE
jgi:hypothetical protein